MRLSINIDHIATLRNARGGTIPDPVDAAAVAEGAGADGIVCHLREDRRHIRDNDVERLRKSISTKLDLEMAATPEIISIALKIKPDLVTLVPEKRQELTTEGGLDIVRLRRPLQTAVKRFHDKGIAVSVFVDRAAAPDGGDAVGRRLAGLVGGHRRARRGDADRRGLAGPPRPAASCSCPIRPASCTPHNDGAIRGAFAGLSHAADRACLTQAVLEGVAFSMRDCPRQPRGRARGLWPLT